MNRDEIFAKLETLEWYNNTSRNLQAQMFSLPPIYDGFLNDLAERPNPIGGILVKELLALHMGNFALIAQFAVTQGDKSYTYEYVSWNRGPASGAKGLVFIRSGFRITHFVLLKGPKFATGFDVFDCVGGFAEVNEEGVGKLLDRMKTELKEELGLPEIKIEGIVKLGNIMPDAGMTNNHPILFAVVLNADQAENIGKLPNLDPFEASAVGPMIYPMSALKDMIMANDDAYFHILVTRSVQAGLIPANLLY